MPVYRDSAETGRESTIQALNFGGLNTVANPLNMPYGDSPDMVNVDTTPGGAIKKRKGTKLHVTSSAARQDLQAITTPSGISFLVGKSGTSLNIYHNTTPQDRENPTISQAMTKSLVFSSFAQNSRATFVVLENPVVTSMMILTGTNIPVIVTIRETPVTLAASAASVVLNIGSDIAGLATTPTSLAYQFDTASRTWQHISAGFSLTPGVPTASNITANFTPVAQERQVSICHITWQWCAEAYQYYGYRWNRRVSRFRASPADRHQPIPEEMRDGLPQYLGSSGLPAMFAILGLASATPPTFVATPSAATNLEYWFSDGTGGATLNTNHQQIHDTWTHITWGNQDFTVAPASQPANAQGALGIMLTRARRINFNGGTNFTPQKTCVVQNGNTISPGISTTLALTPFGWEPRDVNGAVVPLASWSQSTTAFIRFLWGSTFHGVPESADVQIINTEPNQWIGANAFKGFTSANQLTTVAGPYDGGVTPFYGLGDFCDYRRGYFPTVGAIFQGRLCLAGIPNDPVRIIMSGITDTQFGAFQRSFQIDAFTDINGAYDILLDTSIDDYIVGMGEKDGNLFVVTRYSTFRVRNDGQGGFLSSNVANLGATNRSSVINIENRFVFAGDRGLYEIRQSEGLADSYFLAELSIKVSNLFVPGESHSVGYDPVSRKIYCSMNGFTLVFFLETESFSKYVYQVPSGAWEFTSFAVFRSTADRPYLIGAFANNIDFTAIVSTEFQVFADFCQTGATAPTAIFNPAGFAQTPAITLGAGASINYARHQLNSLPISSVQDLTLQVDGATIPFGALTGNRWNNEGKQIVRYGNSTVPAGPNTLDLRYRVPDDGGVIWRQFVSPTGLVNFYGLTFLSYWSTPKFSWGSIATYKRAMWFNMLFKEEIGQPIATQDGVSGNSKDASVGFVYSNESDGSTFSDVYSVDSTVYGAGAALSTIIPPGPTPAEYRRFREPVQGMGYLFQAYVFSYSFDTWELCGYQVEAKEKGRRKLTQSGRGEV